MITLLQIQNFIKENYNTSIHQNLIKDFDEYLIKNNKISINPLKVEFHYNLKMEQKETQAILLFNQYIYDDTRLVKLFNKTPNCNLYFLEFINDNKNKNIIDYINLNSNQILNYISYKNEKIYLELINKIFDIRDKEFYPYLSYIEEYSIHYHKDIYFGNILNIKKIYLDFLDFLDKKFDKKSKLELDNNYLHILKTNDIIINKYMNVLFFDDDLSILFETFDEYNNNLMIFLSMKYKYFNEFINNYQLEFDLKIYTNYNESELFHNNNIKYFFYKD